MNMKLTNLKLTGLVAAIVLTFCSFGAYAEESQEATPPMNKDQVEGRVGEAQGKVKEATGVIVDDKKMQVEGNVQKKLGKAQKGYGDAKKAIKEGE
jgi:CsbD-like.